MEAYDGWGHSSGEYDNRRYLVTKQCLLSKLLLSQEVFVGESCVRNTLDLNYTQLKQVRSLGFIDTDNVRILVTQMI